MQTAAPDPWLTFGPDLLAGFISSLTTGIVVGLVLLGLQTFSESRARRSADISAAYNAVLAVVAEMLHMRLDDDVPMFSKLRYTFTVLAELVDKKEPNFPKWLEAERQYSLYAGATANERISKLPANYSSDQYLKAGSIFFEWTTTFTRNLRFWRTGRLSAEQMEAQTSNIQKLLKQKGAWRTPTERSG